MVASVGSIRASRCNVLAMRLTRRTLPREETENPCRRMQDHKGDADTAASPCDDKSSGLPALDQGARILIMLAAKDAYDTRIETTAAAESPPTCPPEFCATATFADSRCRAPASPRN